MKTSVLSRIGLRLGLQSALAIVATLAVVSSAQAQTTYTWTGLATGTAASSNRWTQALNWDTNTTPTSSLTLTDLVFSGSTRPDTGGGVGLNSRSITFNTSVPFSVNEVFGTSPVTVGNGGVTNQNALKQTFNVRLALGSSGTTPINVASGEIEFFKTVEVAAGQVLEKTGTGTMTLSPGFGRVSTTGDGIFRVKDGTVNVNSILTSDIDIKGGQVNIGNNINWYPKTTAKLDTAGSVLSLKGNIDYFNNPTSGALFQMTDGTLIIGDDWNGRIGHGSTISGGTVVLGTAGTGNGYFQGYYSDPSLPAMAISGGTQNFGNGSFYAGDISAPGRASSVVVTGGTSTGFHYVEGVTNDGG